MARLNHPLQLFTLPARYHFWGSLAIVIVVCIAISTQIIDRASFANSELHHDVMDRWGAPITQASPSVRYVRSGTIFNALKSLPLAGQELEVDARMSYRKRGLVYFSGFEFAFEGRYRVQNQEEEDIDIVFVFPIDLEKNKILLSDLRFSVNGETEKVDLGLDGNKLVWTGRMERDAEVTFDIAYQGRGLDAFTYRLDPDLPVRDFHFAINISGGDNYDYAEGVVSATAVRIEGEKLALRWDYDSLESGVPVGVIVPSETSFDHVIATMVKRSWATFLLFFAGLVGLSIYHRRRLNAYETYLIVSAYAFFFVLLAYLAAYLDFYLAYGVALVLIGSLLLAYVRVTISPKAGLQTLGLFTSFLAVPTTAVILQGHTGLIYALEILVGLGVLMVLTTRPAFRAIIDKLTEEEALATGGTDA